MRHLTPEDCISLEDTGVKFPDVEVAPHVQQQQQQQAGTGGDGKKEATGMKILAVEGCLLSCAQGRERRRFPMMGYPAASSQPVGQHHGQEGRSQPGLQHASPHAPYQGQLYSSISDIALRSVATLEAPPQAQLYSTQSLDPAVLPRSRQQYSWLCGDSSRVTDLCSPEAMVVVQVGAGDLGASADGYVDVEADVRRRVPASGPVETHASDGRKTYVPVAASRIWSVVTQSHVGIGGTDAITPPVLASLQHRDSPPQWQEISTQGACSHASVHVPHEPTADSRYIDPCAAPVTDHPVVLDAYHSSAHDTGHHVVPDIQHQVFSRTVTGIVVAEGEAISMHAGGSDGIVNISTLGAAPEMSGVGQMTSRGNQGSQGNQLGRSLSLSFECAVCCLVFFLILAIFIMSLSMSLS